MSDLWENNSLSNFWHILEDIPNEAWDQAFHSTLETSHFPRDLFDINNYKYLILGEGQFGKNHWRLSTAKRIYYLLKPLLPRKLTKLFRQKLTTDTGRFILGWPIEPRYAQFMWASVHQLIQLLGKSSLPYLHFWPNGYRYAVVLTHDIESEKGQANVRNVVQLEKKYNLRSSFNFIPERYPIDYSLITELRQANFEVGIHGLRHDGKLFNSKKTFETRAKKINDYLLKFDSVGFRSPLTHRNPEWMQILNIKYDLSFFDTDPFEPMPGGTMSIWPFMLGKFIELPYTLAQDYTLSSVLNQQNADIWIEKSNFIKQYNGLALINTHPDYLIDQKTLNIYEEFLRFVTRENDYWNAVPNEVADWWLARSKASGNETNPNGVLGQIKIYENSITLEYNI